jgi:hypothetical protein
MSKEMILELCNHIRQRQDQYGAEDAFRFLSYFNGKEMVEAEYGRNAEDERAAAKSKKQRKSRKESEKIQKSKTKRKGTKPIHEPRPNTPSSTPFQGQIDPSLLSLPTPRTIPEVLLDNNVGGYVDDIAMQKLIAQGYSNTIPVNGPNDGPPRYYVTAAALKLLSHVSDGESHSNPKGTPRHDQNISEDDSVRPSKEADNIDPKPRRSNRVQSVLKDSKITKKKGSVPGVTPTPKMQTRSQKKSRKVSRK